MVIKEMVFIAELSRCAASASLRVVFASSRLVLASLWVNSEKSYTIVRICSWDGYVAV